MLTTGGQITYSADTVTFDTVFTSLGSFTTSVKIYNPQNQKISLSSVRLEKGTSSYFHLNVDGISGADVKNIDIAAKDSIYVFATVNIDPNNNNTPFIVEDKLITTLNGKEYSIPFVAYGQNAHYVVDSALDNQTWGTDKPYVIMHNALVNPGQTLTIQPGCRIYVHADSRLFVQGTLKAIGTKTDSIIFQGDRLDRKYFGNEGYPGEWGGFYFFEGSTNNEMDHVIIRNCGNYTSISGQLVTAAAIQLRDTSIPTSPVLVMKRTVIENSIGYGILSFSSNVKAENCLINTCGANNIALVQGGIYEFNNCDFVNYGTNKVSHTENPVAVVLNYFKIDDTHINLGPMEATFNNCIIWGSLDNELITDKVNDEAYNVKLHNCLVKNKDGISAAVSDKTGTIVNQDPQFADYNKWDYHLKSGSPAKDAGITMPGITNDLDDNPRSGVPDIGCYEFK